MDLKLISETSAVPEDETLAEHRTSRRGHCLRTNTASRKLFSSSQDEGMDDPEVLQVLESASESRVLLISAEKSSREKFTTLEEKQRTGEMVAPFILVERGLQSGMQCEQFNTDVTGRYLFVGGIIRQLQLGSLFNSNFPIYVLVFPREFSILNS
jgi:hypothetical protein